MNDNIDKNKIIDSNRVISGLSTQEAEARLEKYGLNDVVEQKLGLVKKFLAPLYSPISLMLLAAAFLSHLARFF
jgi:magnesium-transporting ATPase (P-type)